MNVLPDTSFLVDLLRGERTAVDHWDALRERGAVAHLCSAVLFELRFGFAWKGDRVAEAEFEALAAAMPEAPVDDHAARHAADLQVQLMRDGIRLGSVDALIAGTAAARDLVLLTTDGTLAQVRQAGVPVVP